MRFFLQLLTLVALVTAPLAAPAAAMATVPDTVECSDMTMDMEGHEMPAGEHQQGKACCIAIPPAIDPPLGALDIAASIDHPAFVVKAEPFRLGAGPKAEDPPPRSA